MSYENNGGLGKYMVPNIPLATTTAGVLREMDIGAASGNHGEYLVVKDCILKRTGFMMVGEAASGTSVAPTVIFTKRPTPLSATAEAVVSTLTIPSGTAIGASTFEDIDVRLAVGDSIELSWTIGTGTPTGLGFAFMECADCPEVAANNTELTATA